MQQEKDILIMMIVTSGMMLLLSGFFVYVVIRSQRRARQKQLEIFNIAFDAQEKEQERVARDLHDQLGPTLSIIKMQIDSIDEQGLDEIDKQIRTEVITQMEYAINDLRSIAHNLIPKTFTEYGFIKSLTYYIVRIKEFNNIEINYTEPKWELTLERNFEINVFRILQELFQNTLKHAQATVIDLTICVEQNRLKIHYTDNGIGIFNCSNETLFNKGIGLNNLKNRTHLLEGNFNINMQKLNGFEIVLSFNLTKKYAKY